MAKRAAANVIVLFKSFDRRLVIARDAQSSIAEDTLRIVDMTPHLFSAPLPCFVARLALLLAYVSQRGGELSALLLEKGQNVVGGDERNIAAVVGQVFLLI